MQAFLLKVWGPQEFRRLSANLGAAKDRAELFAGSSETSIPIGGQVGAFGLFLSAHGISICGKSLLMSRVPLLLIT